MGRNRTLGSPYEIQTASSSFTTNHSIDEYGVNSTNGPVTVTLDPDGARADQVVIRDIGGAASAHPIQILDGVTVVGTILQDGGSVSLTNYAGLGGVTWGPTGGSSASPTVFFIDPNLGTYPLTVAGDAAFFDATSVSVPDGFGMKITAFLSGTNSGGGAVVASMLQIRHADNASPTVFAEGYATADNNLGGATVSISCVLETVMSIWVTITPLGDGGPGLQLQKQANFWAVVELIPTPSVLLA